MPPSHSIYQNGCPNLEERDRPKTETKARLPDWEGQLCSNNNSTFTLGVDTRPPEAGGGRGRQAGYSLRTCLLTFRRLLSEKRFWKTVGFFVVMEAVGAAWGVVMWWLMGR
jgi:hypothetical protein